LACGGKSCAAVIVKAVGEIQSLFILTVSNDGGAEVNHGVQACTGFVAAHDVRSKFSIKRRRL
jgi:hypothetical protein